MNATIKDVAERAGVSIATTSRALTGHPNVSARAREQVLAAAAALGYQPDQIARSMRRRRTNLIGLIVSTIENVFFTEVARAAEQTAHRHGYNLIVCNTEESPQQEHTYLSLLDRQLVAGVILAPAPGHGEHLRPFIENHLPIVLINRHFAHLPLPSITSDDTDVSRQCVSQLIAEGRTRIGAIIGLNGISTTQERLEGYRWALRDAGLSLDPSLQISGGATLEGGYRAMGELLQRSERPDAVFVFNNLMTQGAVMATQDRGLRWPDDIDIAGFGAFQVARLYRPPLILIAQPTHVMGEQAVLKLIAQVEGDDGTQSNMVLPNRIISRGAWDAQGIRGSLEVNPSVALD
jgi:DNA-binding LacI/PurR family transcriptional regulator